MDGSRSSRRSWGAARALSHRSALSWCAATPRTRPHRSRPATGPAPRIGGREVEEVPFLVLEAIARAGQGGFAQSLVAQPRPSAVFGEESAVDRQEERLRDPPWWIHFASSRRVFRYRRMKSSATRICSSKSGSCATSWKPSGVSVRYTASPSLTRRAFEDVPHRHVTFTVPKALRGSFERERMLLKILPPHHKQQRHQGLAGDPGCDEALATATLGRVLPN